MDRALDLWWQFRRRVRPSRARRALDRVGLTSALQWIYYTLRAWRGRMVIRPFGRPFTCLARSRFEIASLEAAPKEEHFTRRMLDALRPADVFYDVGANMGVTALTIAAHAATMQVTVHAFEPEPANARRLAENARLNPTLHIHTYELALGKASGTAQLYVTGGVGVGTHSLLPPILPPVAVRSVWVEAGTEVARALGTTPTIVKIDVEGWEFDVLCGMEPLLERAAVREIFLEVHPHRLQAIDRTPGNLESWLRQRGYVLAWQQGGMYQLHQHYRRDVPSPPATPGQAEALA